MKTTFNVNLEDHINNMFGEAMREDLEEMGQVLPGNVKIEMDMRLRDYLESGKAMTKLYRQITDIIAGLDFESESLLEEAKDKVKNYEFDLKDFDIKYGYEMHIESDIFNMDIEVSDEEVQEVHNGQIINYIVDELKQVIINIINIKEKFDKKLERDLEDTSEEMVDSITKIEQAKRNY